MSALVVIPARYHSSRFPGKLLQKVAHKPILQWVIEGVRECSFLEDVVVATDHKALAQLAENCGVRAIMTPSDMPSGTDRVWAALQLLEREGEVSSKTSIINVQGDEPLVSGALIEDMCVAFDKYPEADMITLARPLENEEELHSPHCVKVLRKANGEALYFSRFPLPYSRSPFPLEGASGISRASNAFGISRASSVSRKGAEAEEAAGAGAEAGAEAEGAEAAADRANAAAEEAAETSLLHIGIYGYRWKCLQELCEQKPPFLEQREGLEQLRALYLNKNIQVLRCAYKNIGVDEAKDIAKVEELLIKRERTRKGEAQGDFKSNPTSNPTSNSKSNPKGDSKGESKGKSDER